MKHYDLIIVGGGFAGTAAALSAARMGLRTLIIEKSNCFGGAAVNNLVNPFMPFWTTDPETKQKIYLSGGIFREILTELERLGAIVHEQTFHEEYLKLVLQRMLLKAGTEILLLSCLSGVKKDSSGKINSLTVMNKQGAMEFSADYFLDATGDGDLAALAGQPYQLGREKDSLCQPMTLCFRVGGVDLEKYRKSRSQINSLYNQFQREGKIKNVRENVLIFSHPVDGVLHFNSTRIVKKCPVDGFEKTEAELEAREQVFELFRFLKENIEGFENAALLSTAMEIGVRESRMITGEYVLTREDLVACTRFEDGVVCGNYDIDIHNPEGSGTSHYYFPAGQYYTIPYRCLCPIGAPNLLVAGRCISSTHEAQASYRIMPICCCLGQAAGTAAALCCRDRKPVGQAPIAELQSILRKEGVLL